MFLRLFYILRRYTLKQIFFKILYIFKPRYFHDYKVDKINTNYPKIRFYSFFNASKTTIKNNKIIIFKREFSSFYNKRNDTLINYYLNYLDFINSKKKLKKKTILNFINKYDLFFKKRNKILYEAYPASIRIFNLIKWDIKYKSLKKITKKNIFIQSEYLYNNLEYHILGNHFFSNIKALIYAGLYFDHNDSRLWLNKSLKLLQQEMEHQILRDGGHYEKSPMYHLNVLQDLIDIYNILNAFSCNRNKMLKNLKNKIFLMYNFAQSISHPNSNMPFINDTNLDSYYSLKDIQKNIYLLFKKKIFKEKSDFSHFPETGILTVRKKNFFLVINLTEKKNIFPTGHAHADTFSYELSYRSNKIIVNTGISRYQKSSTRDFERSSSSHNCTIIDNKNCCDVISSFRLGRNARIYSLKVKKNNLYIQISAKHNGFSSFLKNIELQRTWRLFNNKLEILDKTNKLNKMESFIHLNSNVKKIGNSFLYRKNKYFLVFSRAPKKILNSYIAKGFYNKTKKNTINLRAFSKKLKYEIIFK